MCTQLAGIVSLRAIGPGSTFTNNAAVSAGGNMYPGSRPHGARRRQRSVPANSQYNLPGPVTPGSTIDLGSQTDAAAGTLELSDAELDTISDSVLRVGDGTTGNITVSNPLTANGHYGSLGLSCPVVRSSTAPRPSRPTSPSRDLTLVAAAGIGASDDLDTAVATLGVLQQRRAP